MSLAFLRVVGEGKELGQDNLFRPRQKAPSTMVLGGCPTLIVSLRVGVLTLGSKARADKSCNSAHHAAEGAATRY